MTNKEIVKSFSFILKEMNRFESVTAGLCYDRLHKPSYNVTSPLLNDCCNFCSRNSELKNVVNDFYSSLNDDCSEAICPIGLNIRIKKNDLGDRNIFIVSVGGFNQEFGRNELFKTENRNLKKVYRKARIKASNIRQHVRYDEQVSFLNNIFETLVAGKYSLVIRALSHSVFTSIQGAMADLENIKNKIDMESSLNRLENNLLGISEKMGEIQIVMNDKFVVHENMLRQINIINMLKKMIESVQASAEAKRNRIDMSYFSTKYIHAVPSYYELAISNILTNSIKYSFKGFSDNFLHIKVKECSDDKYFGISIENIGCRIDDDEIKDRRIFELGYRGTNSDDRGRNGTGSGLYIAEKIIVAHGGFITVNCTEFDTKISDENKRYRVTFCTYIPF